MAHYCIKMATGNHMIDRLQTNRISERYQQCHKKSALIRILTHDSEYPKYSNLLMDGIFNGIFKAICHEVLLKRTKTFTKVNPLSTDGTYNFQRLSILLMYIP